MLPYFCQSYIILLKYFMKGILYMAEEFFDEESDNIVILNDEDGNDVKFEFLDLIEYEGNQYVVLLPAEESEDDGEVVILEVEEADGDEETYSSVEDSDILEAVYQIFKDRFKEDFNFID